MVCVYAANKVSEENQKEFIEIAKKLVEETVKEDGCISYEFCIKDDNLVFFERWETQEHLDAHGKTEHFTKYVPMLGPLSISSEVVVLEKQF